MTDETKDEPKGLRVKPINNGTVIDHIAGSSERALSHPRMERSHPLAAKDA